MILVGLTGGMGQGKTTVGRMMRELAGSGPECDLESSYVIGDLANEWMKHWPAKLELEPGKDLVDLANALIKSLPDALEEALGRKATFDQLKILRTEESLELHKGLPKYLSERIAVGDKTSELYPTPITPATKNMHRDLFRWLGGIMITLVDPRIWGQAHDRRIKELASLGVKFVTVGGIRADNEAEMIRSNGGLIVKVIRPDAEVNNDLTERIMIGIKPDIELVNNGSFKELETIVGQLYRDITDHKLTARPSQPVRYLAKPA